VTRPSPQTSRKLQGLPLLWAIPAVMLLIFGATLAWFAYDEYERTIEREYRYLESNAHIADAQLSGLLRNLNRFLADIAADQQTLRPEKHAEYDAYLQEQKKKFPEIRSLVVVNASGTVTLTGNPNLKGFDSSKRDYFVAHLGQPLEPNFYASRPFKTSFGDMGIAFSLAIYDAQKKFQGTVVTGIDPKYFEAVLRQITPIGPSGSAALFHLAGELIYRLPDPDRYFGTNITSAKTFQNHVASGALMTRYTGVSISDGLKRMYVIKTIKGTKLGLSVSRDLDEILAEWRVSLTSRILLFLLATFVILGLTMIAHRREEERRQAEIQLRLSLDRLTSSNTELERFAYVASHDLREPIRTLVSFSQLLERRLGGGLNDDIRECLDFIITAAKRMDGLVKDLLSYSRIASDENPFKPVDLNKTLDQVQSDLALAIERSGAEIVAAPLPTLPGVELQLYQLFQNLVSNAIKFRNKDQPPRLEITAWREGGSHHLTFTDNGIGFNAEYAERIFEIFKRLHTGQAYPGTGVGLAICRRIVERHNGRIWAEPRSGEAGSVFHLTFPDLEGKAEASAKTPH
jgi:signal transduction histidine kinase